MEFGVGRNRDGMVDPGTGLGAKLLTSTFSEDLLSGRTTWLPNPYESEGTQATAIPFPELALRLPERASLRPAGRSKLA